MVVVEKGWQQKLPVRTYTHTHRHIYIWKSWRRAARAFQSWNHRACICVMMMKTMCTDTHIQKALALQHSTAPMFFYVYMVEHSENSCIKASLNVRWKTSTTKKKILVCSEEIFPFSFIFLWTVARTSCATPSHHVVNKWWVDHEFCSSLSYLLLVVNTLAQEFLFIIF